MLHAGGSFYKSCHHWDTIESWPIPYLHWLRLLGLPIPNWPPAAGHCGVSRCKHVPSGWYVHACTSAGASVRHAGWLFAGCLALTTYMLRHFDGNCWSKARSPVWWSQLAGSFHGIPADVRVMHQAESPIQHDVRLRLVNGIVHPAPRLLHAQVAPLGLRGDSASLTIRARLHSSSMKQYYMSMHILDGSTTHACGMRTSDSSLFFGSSFAMSDGSTTCLRSREDRCQNHGHPGKWLACSSDRDRCQPLYLTSDGHRSNERLVAPTCTRRYRQSTSLNIESDAPTSWLLLCWCGSHGRGPWSLSAITSRFCSTCCHSAAGGNATYAAAI